MAVARIIIVEDEGVVAINIQLRLQTLGYDVLAIVDSGEEAVRQVAALRPDLVLMDIRLTGAMDGVSAAAAIREQFDLPVVYLTAYTDDATLQRAKNTEPYGYIIKPFDIRELHTAIVIALHKHVRDRQLRVREHWLASMLNNIDDALIASDAAGRVTYLNPAGETLTGWQKHEALGQTIEQVFSTIDAQSTAAIESPLARALREGREVEQTVPVYLLRRDGERQQVEGSAVLVHDQQGQLTGAMLVFRAADEQTRAQALRWERQKLQVLTEMASGMAHDFSDLLTVILGSTSIALDDLPQESTLHPFISLIDTAARRAVDLTQQMFAYSGQGRVLMQPVNLNTLIDEVLAHDPPLAGIQMMLQLDPQLPLLVIDGNQISRVIRSIVTNASEAIGELGGVITITTGVRYVDREAMMATYLAPDLPEGDYVAIEIADNGSGMSPQVMVHVFEPFFTTKLIGRGLGLPVALGIVNSHQGLIRIDSLPGRGTSVTILLPLASYPAASLPRTQSAAGEAGASGFDRKE